MKYEYKIIHDIKKDMWNWRWGVKDSMFGHSNLDNVRAEDRKIAEQVFGLKKQPAELMLKPYLLTQKNNPDSKLNKFIQIVEKDFCDKYVDACKALERITRRPMMSDKFTFYITTFPRMVYFYEECIIYMYNSTEGVWGMPIDGFLHEALHFQFTHYWRDDKNSPVSKLSDDEFNYLKEALTVILDEELKPIITLPDCSYQFMHKFRDVLHENWKKYHDFDKLIGFGLGILNNYVN